MATKDGIVHARSVKRIPKGERWTKDCVDWVRWAPWNRYKDAQDADGDVPEGVPAEDRVAEEDKDPGRGTVFVRTRNVPPRDFQIRREDADKHGITRGCPGCMSWFRGTSRQAHSEECRNRFRDLLKGEARMLNQQKR